jgi:EAL domain-containing protein (putative c-di-GMP-specific phosphodiesterase class I)/DNA-binding response OmpR family regulator
MSHNGTPASHHATEHNEKETTQAAERILLVIESQANRREIARLLSQRYTVVEPQDSDLADTPFDLAIADGPGLRRHRDALAEARSVARPVFLPVILILPRSDLRGRLGELVNVIDDFVASPIDRTEFLERVYILLRARRQALTQHEDLVRIVNYDRTTGLPNRHLFADRIAGALPSADSQGLTLVVLVMNIPLVQVRRTLGERAVEEAALSCAYSLSNAFDSEVCLARLGDQQWGAYMLTSTPMSDAVKAHEHVSAIGKEPISAGGESFRVSPRMGVAVYPTDATSAADLVDAATDASSQADSEAPAFHAPDNRNAALHYLRTEARLHEALAEDQFELWLQPKVPLQGDATAITAEALIRWRRPDGELVPPGDFIPVAETSGFIRQITAWVLTTAARTVAGWQAQGKPWCQIAVNVTPADIQHDGFLDWLQRLCDEQQIQPQSLALELTETMFCDMGAHTLDQLSTLRDAGFDIAIDDFGTGYSSLALLHRLPAGTLKIDKSFVDNLPDDTSGSSIVQAIINLAHEFGLRVVAEGIENQAQLEHLRQAGANVAQGYLIARPMPLADFEAWWQQRS